ncbi:MAG: hypothetical protein EPO28_15880 [Saprospiraceae bacterium]|nr:MAG: hypothetical protein EPO28_15880 [Saprospiraceae bacterium]
MPARISLIFTSEQKMEELSLVLPLSPDYWNNPATDKLPNQGTYEHWQGDLVLAFCWFDPIEE